MQLESNQQARLNFRPAGDSAVLVTLGDQMDPSTNRRVHQLARVIADQNQSGVGEVVPGYVTLLIHYEPLIITYSWLEKWLNDLGAFNSEDEEVQNRVEVPVRYGGEFGPDLDFVAQYHQITAEEVIRIHSSCEYQVYMIGFSPGFPYLGGMDPAIATPRLETPRSLVPAGSVGIAGEQTGIYPIDSPGGWCIIGRTDLHLFDLDRDPPFYLSPGDRVTFVPTHGGGC